MPKQVNETTVQYTNINCFNEEMKKTFKPQQRSILSINNQLKQEHNFYQFAIVARHTTVNNISSALNKNNSLKTISDYQ